MRPVHHGLTQKSLVSGARGGRRILASKVPAPTENTTREHAPGAARWQLDIVVRSWIARRTTAFRRVNVDDPVLASQLRPPSAENALLEAKGGRHDIEKDESRRSTARPPNCSWS